MCCNSEDMWVFGGLMSHDCNILGEPSFCCPGNHVTHQRSQKTAYLQHRSSTHTRQCRAACVCVCVSVQKCIGESRRRAWGRVFVNSLKTPFHQWRPSPLRAEPLLWYWLSSVAWLVVYLCTKLTVESMWWIFFLKFCIFCTRGKEPNVTNIIPIRWHGLKKGNAIYRCASEKMWRVSLLDDQFKARKAVLFNYFNPCKGFHSNVFFRYLR